MRVTEEEVRAAVRTAELPPLEAVHAGGWRPTAYSAWSVPIRPAHPW